MSNEPWYAPEPIRRHGQRPTTLMCPECECCGDVVVQVTIGDVTEPVLMLNEAKMERRMREAKGSIVPQLMLLLSIVGVAAAVLAGGRFTIRNNAAMCAVAIPALLGSWMMWSASGVRDHRPVIAAIGGLLCLPAGVWIGLWLSRFGIGGCIAGISILIAWCSFLGHRSRRIENET